MKMAPTGEYLVVRLIPDDEVRSSTIHIPKDVQKKYDKATIRGEVVFVSPCVGAWERELEKNGFTKGAPNVPSVGDEVFLARYAGYPVLDSKDDATYQVVSEKDITVILEKDDE